MASEFAEQVIQGLQQILDARTSHQTWCLVCKQETFFERHGQALRPGHIYSDAGRREFEISHTCEWCFDRATYSPDDEPTCWGCLTGDDVGVPYDGIAYPMPGCPVHDPAEPEPPTEEERDAAP